MIKIAYLHPVSKLVIAISISIISLLIILSYPMMSLTRIMVCWDVFAFCYLSLCWITFYYTEISGIQRVAKSQDKGHIFIFAILVCSTIVSLFTVLLLLKSRGERGLAKELVEAIYFLGVFFSWLLLHTIYSFHYAHLYYSNRNKIKDEKRGLMFPGETNPNYIDFAYFSFVIGMTCQVSDVTITSRQLRQIVLVHSLISFLFNAIIIALCVNAIVNI